MKKKHKALKSKKDRKSVSFLTATLSICLVSFLIGLYMAHWEKTEAPISRTPEVERELPEKIIVEGEENNPSQKTSLKPEELTFFKTLLSNSEKEIPDEIPEAPPEKKTAIIKETDISEGAMVDENGQGEAHDKKAVVAKEEKAAVKTHTPALGHPLQEGHLKEEGAIEKMYKIQIGSFALESEAERRKKELMAKGYPGTFVQPMDLPGKGTWYRVYTGKYGTFESAQKAEKDIQSKENLSTLIILEKN
jgi:cell division protein FtsN